MLKKGLKGKLGGVPDEIFAASSDSRIARLFGISRERVRQVRKERGLPPSLQGRKGGSFDHIKRGSPLDGITVEQWATLSNRAIGKLIKRSDRTVSGYRKARGKPPVPKRVNKLAAVTDEQWRTMLNAEVAELVGLSRKSVAQYRSDHNKPRSPRRPGRVVDGE